MAKHVWLEPTITLNGQDLTDHVKRCSFVVTIIGQPASAVSDVEDYSMPGKRKVSPISLEMFQDFAASEVYATLMTLWTNRTSFNAVLKNSSAATAATNPQFTISVFISSFPVIDATDGETHMTNIVLEPAGVLAIATS